MPDVSNWSGHTAYSDPGPYRPLLLAVPDHLSDLCTAARNVIGHYRAELPELPASRRSEIDSRWLDCILRTDQARHPFPLLAPRPPTDRVAGCCRDHSLFVVGALRARNIPARTRVGFASYLVPDYRVDHVVVEFWAGGRWRRADPEIAPGSVDFDPEDMSSGIGSPFRTAAEAWDGYRRGLIRPERHCVFPGSELSGPDLVRAYVVIEVAHRYGDEMLLWDRWGDAAYQSDDAVIDRLTELLLSADSGEEAAEDELAVRYRNDARLHPGTTVSQYSPFGDPAMSVRLR
ncbi:MAG TPA: transglutaminase domain-containing protein [Pseudonocardia sp.]